MSINERLNNIITTLKENRQITIAVSAMLIIFVYKALSDFLVPPSTNTLKGENKKVEFSNIANIDKDTANMTVSESQEQRGLLVSEEKEIRNKKMNDIDASYQRKRMDLSDNIVDTINTSDITSIRESQNKDLEINNKVDLSIKDSKGQNIDLDSLDVSIEKANNNYIPKLKKEISYKKDIKSNQEKNVTSFFDGTNNRQNDMNPEEISSTLDLLISSIPQYENTGSAYQIIASNENPINSIPGINNNDINSEQIIKELDIKPGSSYMAKLMTPLNNLYSEQIKPILDIQSGDLMNYRALGEISFQESTDGLIISIHTLIDDNNNQRYSVNGFALKYDGDDMTPTFADEIDRHLMGRIGYSALSGVANDYASVNSTALGSNLLQRVGDQAEVGTAGVLGDTFSELAQQYKTEVKVNPKMMYLVFY